MHNWRKVSLFKIQGMSKYVTAAQAVQVVKSGDRVYLQAAAAEETAVAIAGQCRHDAEGRDKPHAMVTGFRNNYVPR